jgi:glycosyltransferase involved in cell wall biosynthesis
VARTPKVSVLTITYNHEDYIAQTLDSVLVQETDFDFEVVVSDDQSGDRTAEIVAEYAERHPEQVRPFFNETNIGPHRNFLQSRAQTRGEYLALLDGDDFWSSPTKLQQQADYLDANPGCALVFHPVEILEPDGSRRTWSPPRRRTTYDLGDLLEGNFIATGSVMCRNRLGVEFPAWYPDSTAMPDDWAFFSLNARHGFIGYLDQTMSVYRLHDTGIWTGARAEDRGHRLEMSIELCQRLNAEFDHAYTRSVRKAVALLRLKIAIQRTSPFLVKPLAKVRDLARRTTDRLRLRART